MIDGDLPRQLRETKQAFDSVAADYDGPRGNNALIQDMRAGAQAPSMAGTRISGRSTACRI